MDVGELISRFKSLRAAGELPQGLSELRQALRRGTVDADGLDQVGRLLVRHANGMPKEAPPLSVLILGQCTTTWMLPALTAVAWGRGRAIRAREGGYDNVIQDLAALNATGTPDVIVLLPWHQRLLAADARGGTQRIEDELAVLRQAWEAVKKSGTRLIQVGYDWTHPGAQGYHLSGAGDGKVGLIVELNERVREEAPKGSYFVDLPQISGETGRQQFYDPRSYYWTKQPFSRAGLARLCEHVWAGIRAVTTGPKKVLVLDLDNTLWGGVVGEVGPQGVALGDNPEGEAFRAFQREIKGLSARGIVLAVCSKNNPKDAREVFETNTDMILKLEDFAAFEASWDPKPTAIERIAKTLHLGLDSFVFFDDNPAEREIVLQMLPDVEVADVPADPCGYVRTLHGGLWFEAAALTEADRARAEQYREEQSRRQAEETAGSVEAYLESLKMIADLRPLDDSDMERVVQLLGKTNQFNLTTRRHTAGAVRRILEKDRSLCLTLRISDRFGDAGLIGLVLAEPMAGGNVPTLRLDTWLMSCRVIARTVEQFMMNQVVARAAELGYKRLRGEFIPTAKNQLVVEFYDKAGFSRLAEDGKASGGTIEYQLDVAAYQVYPSPIQLKN